MTAPGPQEARLRHALTGADDGVLGDAATEWRITGELLGTIATHLTAASAEKRFGGMTGPAVSERLATAATQMTEDSVDLSRGSASLARSALVVHDAREALVALDADPQTQHLPDPGPWTPPVGPLSDEDVADQRDNDRDRKRAQRNLQEREDAARKWAERMDTVYSHEIVVMKRIHGVPDSDGDLGDPLGDPTDGGGGRTPAPGLPVPPLPPRGPRGPRDPFPPREPQPPRDVDPPRDPSVPPGGPGTVVPPGVPGHPGYPGYPGGPGSDQGADVQGPSAPQPGTGGTGVGAPGTGPGGGTLGPPPSAGGGAGGVSPGALAGASGILGGAGGVRGGAPGVVPGASSGARPIGSSTRGPGAPGALGRSGAAAGGVPTSRPGAGGRAGAGGAAGRAGSKGTAGGRGAAAGAGTQGRRTGKGAGAAGAGGRRGGGKDQEREGRDRDLFDDGQDWIDDEGAAPGVLD